MNEFIECLGEIAMHSEVGSEDFLSYTREWLEKVNRGGLFPLNDETFVFCVIEKEVQILLPAHLVKQANSKEEFDQLIIEGLVENEEIQSRWLLISRFVDSENAIELYTPRHSEALGYCPWLLYNCTVDGDV